MTNVNAPTFAVIDLFAGPGGLAEGFSKVRSGTFPDARPYHVALSIEKEHSAHKTLLLRSFLRQFNGDYPDEYYDYINGDSSEPEWGQLYPDEWRTAQEEAWLHELRSEEEDAELFSRLDELVSIHGRDRLVLIGGPPCQPYSLVGRARNKGIVDYTPESDPRHTLYKAYIRIIQYAQPAAFVMENVKGMLSAKANGQLTFNLVRQDLEGAGYVLFPLAGHHRVGLFSASLTDVHPVDFVIRCEDFGIPQARHRVIVVGIRKDLLERHSETIKPELHRHLQRVTVNEAIVKLPKLRSGLSKQPDSWENWSAQVREAVNRLSTLVPRNIDADKLDHYWTAMSEIRMGWDKPIAILQRKSGDPYYPDVVRPNPVIEWMTNRRLARHINHDSRSHIAEDLQRYLFAIAFSRAYGFSPKAGNYPDQLSPKHENWRTGKFSDRFRVQLPDSPSTTVTSHISKDGHYFIHPDPYQCRSLTVREAARLQSFPDDYLFLGNRTQQYVQVGNAVPPYLAMQIGEVLYEALVRLIP